MAQILTAQQAPSKLPWQQLFVFALGVAVGIGIAYFSIEGSCRTAAVVEAGSPKATAAQPLAVEGPAGPAAAQVRNPSSSTNSIISDFGRSFYDAAKTTLTDKVAGGSYPNGHEYDTTYQKYLGHIPGDYPLKILEIGLGCDMPKGEGGSFALWKALFPKASVSFIELKADCAEKYRGQIEGTDGKLFIGSQVDAAVFAAVAAQGAIYDIIIDDGSHMPQHQRQSLEGLWPAVKPGGLYIVEDLLTTYFNEFSTDFENGINPLLKQTIDELTCMTTSGRDQFADNWRQFCDQPSRIGYDFLTMDCATDICAFVKRPL